MSKNTALTTLDCYGTQITTLDVSHNTALDLSKNTALTTLVCGYNQLTELDVSNNKSRWGNIPKPTTLGEHEYQIRLKSTASGTSGAAASVIQTLRITYDEYETAGKTKYGIIEAKIKVN